MRKAGVFPFIPFLALAIPSWAHIDSLKFNGALIVTQSNPVGVGGQKFSAGQKVDISWYLEETHTTMAVYFSKNGGTSWSLVVSNLPRGTRFAYSSYSWTVPDSVTTNAKIRVYQSGSATQPGNVINDYNLISGAFTIQTGSPVFGAGGKNSFSISPAPGAIQILFPEAGFSASRAEILAMNGAVMRSFPIAPGATESSLATAGLPNGKAVFRLAGTGGADIHRLVFIRP